MCLEMNMDGTGILHELTSRVSSTMSSVLKSFKIFGFTTKIPPSSDNYPLQPFTATALP